MLHCKYLNANGMICNGSNQIEIEFDVNYGYATANAAFHIFSFFNDTHCINSISKTTLILSIMLIIVFVFKYLHEFGWYLT